MVNQLNPDDGEPKTGVALVTQNVHAVLKHISNIRDGRTRKILREELKMMVCKIIDEYPDEFKPEIIT